MGASLPLYSHGAHIGGNIVVACAARPLQRQIIQLPVPLTYLLKQYSLPDVEHRPPTNCFHLARSCADASSEPHVTPASFSASHSLAL